MGSSGRYLGIAGRGLLIFFCGSWRAVPRSSEGCLEGTPTRRPGPCSLATWRKGGQLQSATISPFKGPKLEQAPGILNSPSSPLVPRGSSLPLVFLVAPQKEKTGRAEGFSSSLSEQSEARNKITNIRFPGITKMALRMASALCLASLLFAPLKPVS